MPKKTTTKVKAPTVEDVRLGAARLRPETQSLQERLRILCSGLTAHLPAEPDSEAMAEGQCPPSMAWAVHCWLGAAQSMAADLVTLLERMATATEAGLLAGWLRRQCSPDHTDPRTGLTRIVAERKRAGVDGAEVAFPLPALDEDADPDVWRESLLRAATVDLAEQLYRTRTGEELEIPEPDPPGPTASRTPPPHELGELLSWLEAGVRWVDGWLSVVSSEVLDPPPEETRRRK